MPEDSEPEIEVKTKLGKTNIVWRFSIGVVLAVIAGYLLLYSDRHNDGRYVSIESYNKDRERDKELRDEISRSITRQLDEQRKTVDEIRGDVKRLLERGK